MFLSYFFIRILHCFMLYKATRKPVFIDAFGQNNCLFLVLSFDSILLINEITLITNSSCFLETFDESPVIG